MSPITTPDDDHRPVEPPANGYRTITLEPGAGANQRPRLITTTDELLTEILKRPGQRFVVKMLITDRGTAMSAWMEFADGTKVQVQTA